MQFAIAKELTDHTSDISKNLQTAWANSRGQCRQARCQLQTICMIVLSSVVDRKNSRRLLAKSIFRRREPIPLSRVVSSELLIFLTDRYRPGRLTKALGTSLLPCPASRLHLYLQSRLRFSEILPIHRTDLPPFLSGRHLQNHIVDQLKLLKTRFKSITPPNQLPQWILLR